MKRKLKLFNTKKNHSLAKKERAKTHPRKVIILMSMSAPVHAVTAVMNMPADYNGRKDRAVHIIAKCTGNAYVTIAPGVITAMNTKLTNYTTAATPALRKTAWIPLNNGLKSLMATFQLAANDDIENSIVIIESGGFKVKQRVINQKQKFKAVNGVISGDIVLTAPGGPKGSVHNWSYSHDGVTWIKMDGTRYAKTHKDGFAPGEKVYFTHNLSIKDIPQGVSPVFEIIVK